MNGVHDMGGMHGMGPVEVEREEPVFHAEWEGRVFALNLASGYLGKWNIDMGRSAREQMPPAVYLAASYYERWLWGLAKLLVDAKLLGREEIAARLAGTPTSLPPSPTGQRVLRAADVPAFTGNPRGARMDGAAPARFAAGDHVVAKNLNPIGHTRLPRYVRGRRGVIDRAHGAFVFPDAAAAGQGRQPQHCYSVRFAARELWGADAPERDAVYVDLFEPYLEPA
jgi:nitrile hydratase